LIVKIRRVFRSVEPWLQVDGSVLETAWVEDACDVGRDICQRSSSGECERQNRLHERELRLRRVRAIVADRIIITYRRIIRPLSRTHSQEEEDSSEEHRELEVEVQQQALCEELRSGVIWYLPAESFSLVHMICFPRFCGFFVAEILGQRILFAWPDSVSPSPFAR